jgi:hypothetical protein
VERSNATRSAPDRGSAPQYTQPPKKKHTLRNVLLVILLLFVLAIGGCMALIAGAANEVDKASKRSHEVTYLIGGTTKKADLTYTTDGGTSTEQTNGVKVPWKKVLNIKGDILAVYQISAQNTGRGTVTCEILVDGKSVKKAQSKGFAAIASCDYTK